MTEAPWFGLLVIGLVGGVAFDIWFGKTIRWRKPLQLALVVLYVLVALTMPRCSDGDPNQPDIEAPPYMY